LLFAAMTTIDPSLPPALELSRTLECATCTTGADPSDKGICKPGAETEVYGNAFLEEKEKSGDSSHN
jgi:hypothetical protein